MSDDERAIRTVIETWITASQAGDDAKVLDLMSDDVVFMVAGQEPFGKDAFASATRSMKGVSIEAKSEIVEVKASGDMGFCRTRLTVTATPPGGAPVRRSGYTLSIFRKNADGSWVLTRDANLLTVR